MGAVFVTAVFINCRKEFFNGSRVAMCAVGGKHRNVNLTKKLLPIHIKPGTPFTLQVQGAKLWAGDASTDAELNG